MARNMLRRTKVKVALEDVNKGQGEGESLSSAMSHHNRDKKHCKGDIVFDEETSTRMKDLQIPDIGDMAFAGAGDADFRDKTKRKEKDPHILETGFLLTSGAGDMDFDEETSTRMKDLQIPDIGDMAFSGAGNADFGDKTKRKEKDPHILETGDMAFAGAGDSDLQDKTRRKGKKHTKTRESGLRSSSGSGVKSQTQRKVKGVKESEPDMDVIDFEKLIETTNKNQGTKYASLKEKQKEALYAARESDAVCVLPTGYGKTVIIQMLPFLQPDCPPSMVVVITPLNVILEEQRIRFGETCVVVDATLINDLNTEENTSVIEKLKQGNCLFILAHPECIVEPVVRKVLTTHLSNKISHIIIDECHCILSWGKSEFRPAFMKLSCLRSSLPKAKILALTATATRKALHEVQSVLCMANVQLVKASPDRPSVYIEVKKRPAASGGENTVQKSYTAVVDPLLHELKEMGRNFPRTIIYLPLDWCGYIHARALAILEEPAVTETPLVAQYHAPQTAKMKQMITEAMSDPESCLRLVLATEAYGMGADCPNVRHVVHVSPPSNLETYIQEIGRSGRDGKAASATLYFNNADIGKHKLHMDDKMRIFCKLKEKCRREYLMFHFGFRKEADGQERCCDNCSRDVPPEIGRNPQTPKVNHAIAGVLMQYFNAVNAQVEGLVLKETATGLCLALAHKISREPSKFIEDGKLAEQFPFLKPSHIENIIAVLAITSHLQHAPQKSKAGSKKATCPSSDHSVVDGH